LARIHRTVRGRDDLGRRGVSAEQGSSYAGADLHMHVPVHHAYACEQSFQLPRFRHGLRLVDPPEQHAKFVGAQAADNVGGADMAGDLARDGLEQRVAGPVAVEVVDRIEIVEVHEHHRGRCAIAFGMGERAFEFALEPAAIEDIEQGVDVGARLELTDAGTRHRELTLQTLDFGQQRRLRRKLLAHARFSLRQTHVWTSSVSRILILRERILLSPCQQGASTYNPALPYAGKCGVRGAKWRQNRSRSSWAANRTGPR